MGDDKTMTRLWQRLDPQGVVVLMSPEGAEAFLRQFPEALAVEIGHLTAEVLDSEVDDSEGDALGLFASRFAALLAEDPDLQQAVHRHWVAQGQMPALSALGSPTHDSAKPLS